MRKFRKQTALFCAGMIGVFLLAGCGGSGRENKTDAPDTKGSNAADTESGEKRMGRYLETEITVPEEVKTMDSYPAAYLQTLDDSELILAELAAGRYISSDRGEGWVYADCPWQDIISNAYISDIALSPDRAAAVLYCPYAGDGEDPGEEMQDDGTGEGSEVSEEEMEPKSAEDRKAADETGEEAGSETAGEVTSSGGEGAETAKGEEEADGDTNRDLEEITYKTVYFDADGTGTELDLPTAGDGRIQKLAFDRQGRLYGFMLDGIVCRIDPAAGTKQELFDTEGIMNFVCFTDRYMVGFTTRKEAVIYDLEKEAPAEEDKILQTFISENLGSYIGGMERGHELIATAGEQEDIIYFAFSGGVYRHVIGGTAIEQIIDGTTSSFGDPSMVLMDMVMLPDNEFVVLYNDVTLYRYTYDPDVPAVPEKQLKVYSLVENYSMRQAVSLFQKMHQDVYIRYEVGMSGTDGMTGEDAVRNLNAKIMSGEGPDILLLDGLPQDSYEEKGILADMSVVVDGLGGEDKLFPNVVEACRKDGKIYGLPVRIQIPMMAGDEKYVEKIRDIDTLADAVEEIRRENPEGAILGLKSEEQLLYVLSLTSSAAWTDEKGNIEEEELEEFLTAAGRIWQAEISGVDVEWLKEKTNFSAGFPGEEQYYATLSTNAINITTGEQKLAVGKVYRVDFDYAMVTSIAGMEEGDFGFGLWNGQVSGGFIPDGMTGVAAASAEDELAVEFYKFLFGRELQDMDLSGGLPVNMASFDTFAKNPRAGAIGGDEDLSGSLALGGDDGVFFSLDVLWPKEEEFRKLREMAGSVSRISTGDTAIEEAVYEIGPDVLNGNITPQEAVKEIVKKSAIYLAE